MNASQAERPELRTLTLLFCDLVGSTALSERLEPELLREVVRSYQAVCVQTIEHFGGYVAQYLGDGVLAYFGFPTTQEDDAERAVRAALQLTAAVPLMQLPRPIADVSLQVRIGLHTGETVTGEVGAGRKREHLALGEAPNIAARLQALAEPNTVVLSEVTARLTEQRFAFESLGTQSLRGVARKLQAYRVLPTPPTRPVAERARLVPLLGRANELARLLQGLQAAQASQGVLLIGGEPGVGKTRLAQELRLRLRPEDGAVAYVRCSAREATRFLHPFANALAEWAGIADDDSASVRAERLQAFLAGQALPERAAEHLGGVLGLPQQAQDVRALAGKKQKAETLDALRRVLLGMCAGHRLLLFVEDVQWADSLTLELLTDLLQASGGPPVACVVTHRPEFTPPAAWPLIEQLQLAALEDEHARALVRELSGELQLSAAAVDQILVKADGLPLFVEELTKQALEAGPGVMPSVPPSGETRASGSIPASLRASVTRRLERLATAAGVAQYAAVAGRRFSFELMQAATPLHPSSLRSELQALMDAGILVAQVDAATTYYEFRHALLQDAIYESLLVSTRMSLHRRLVRALEGVAGQTVEVSLVVRAEHWARGGAPELAAPLFERAAARAASVYANTEASALYRSAIAQLQRAIALADDAAAHAGRLKLSELHEHLGDVLALVRDQAAAREAFRGALAQCSEAAYLQQARLFRKLGLVDQQEPYAAERAFGLAETALARAEASESEAVWRQEWVSIRLGKLWMHYWQGHAEAMRALLVEIRPFVDEHATVQQRSDFWNHQVLSNVQAERYHVSAETEGFAHAYVRAAEASGELSEKASAVFTLGCVLLFAQDPRRAEEPLLTALELAVASGYRAIEIRATTYAGILYRLLGNVERVRTLSDKLMELATAAQIPEYVGMAKANLAWVALAEGESDAAALLAEAAQASFDQATIAYVFRWAALLPLLAVALQRSDEASASACVRALLRPEQQRLREPLWSELARALASWDAADSRSALEHVQAAVVSAAQLGYLPHRLSQPRIHHGSEEEVDQGL